MALTTGKTQQILRSFVCLFVISVSLSACLRNEQLRTEHVKGNCVWDNVDCRNSMIEEYPEYDLTFIEFTERGNLFSREDSQEVLDFINRQANHDDGVAVFVFVHGWKHNADFDDSNVQQFREFLSRAAENEIVGERKVIGLYLGWRGDITNVPIARDLSYWARKSVAEEVGAGGATEVFSQLHQILVQQFDNQIDNKLYKNTYVIIGHSFGGAIVLSALHDVLLKDLVEANTSLGNGPNPCNKIKRFADALLLLNPAIEANKVILLKEAAARCKFDERQPTLMHIISSDADNATKIFFPIGQYANITATLSPKKLERTVNGKKIILDERMLDVITAGNLEQIRTSYLSYDKEKNDWLLSRCRDDLAKCGITKKKQQKNHFTVREHDPLAFIKTDKHFIKGHNDVFGCYVQSFITTVIFETQSIDKGYLAKGSTPERSDSIEGCDHLNFDFKQCFNNQLDDYECGLPF